ncbi:MAG: restriction endonuclease [Acidobacteria bacterium]|nr:MAG: restriction endonuclease [Acidobacteriota bacterium]
MSGSNHVKPAGSGLKLTYDPMIIGGWLETHPLGRPFYAPFDVVFSKYDVVEPDLLYVSNERSNALTAPNVQGAPDLVIEIGSPGTRKRDETIERNLYGRSGVSEYWFVDPDIDVIRAYRQGGEGFSRPIELSREAGYVLTTTLMPGLDLPLARTFRE